MLRPLQDQDLAARPAAAPTPIARACPNCGQPLPFGVQGCPSCGRGTIQALGSVPTTGVVLNQRFQVLQRMGGGMSTLLLVQDDHRANAQAMLKLPIDAATGRAIRREFDILQRLHHPAVPRVFEQWNYQGQAALLLEYIPGADLEKRLSYVNRQTGATIFGRAYPKITVMRWAVQLCQLLDVLEHADGGPIIHHDIKPANIVHSAHEDVPVLIDWGTARQHPFSATISGKPQAPESGPYGTVGYAPPEQYRGESTPRSDVYALAATLYHLATNDDPSNHPFSFPKLGELEAFGWLLFQALSMRPEARPNAAALGRKIQALLHLKGEGLLAPDGTALQTPQDLTNWSVVNWPLALAWLQRGMAEALALWWPQYHASYARFFAIAKKPDLSDVDLDQALLILDPGYAAEQPALTIASPKVNFGMLSQSTLNTRSVAVQNTGKRLLRLKLDPTPYLWLRITPAMLHLPPGASSAIQLHIDPDKLKQFGGTNETLSLKLDGVPLANLSITAQRSIQLGSSISPHRNPMGRIIPWIFFAMMILWNLPGLINTISPPASNHTIEEWSTPSPTPRPTATIALPPVTGGAIVHMRLLSTSAELANSTDWRAMEYASSQFTTEQRQAFWARAYQAGERLSAMQQYRQAADAFHAASVYPNAGQRYRDNIYQLALLAKKNEDYVELQRLVALIPEDTELQALRPATSVMPVKVKWKDNRYILGTDFVFAEGDRQLIGLSLRNQLVFYDSANGEVISQKNIETKQGDKLTLTRSSDGLIILTHAQTHILEVYDILNQYRITISELLVKPDHFLALAPDRSQYAMFEDSNKGPLLMVVGTSRYVRQLPKGSSVAQLSFSNDAQVVGMLLKNSDGDAFIWDASHELHIYADGNPVTGIAISPDGKQAALSRADGAVRLIDTNSGATLWTTDLANKEVTSLVFSEVGTLLISRPGQIWQLRTQDGILLNVFDTQNRLLTKLTVSPDGQRIAGIYAGQLMLWEQPKL